MNKVGAFFWIISKLVVLPWCVLSIFGCTSSTMPPPKKPSAQMLEESVRRADVLIALEREFAGAHKLKGMVIKVATERLGAEGFHCSLEYKRLPVIKKGTIDQLGIETVPMVYCSRKHTRRSVDDVCNVMWAAFEVDWRDPSQPPETLLREFDVSTIRDERYFCRVNDDRKNQSDNLY